MCVRLCNDGDALKGKSGKDEKDRNEKVDQGDGE